MHAVARTVPTICMLKPENLSRIVKRSIGTTCSAAMHGASFVADQSTIMPIAMRSDTSRPDQSANQSNVV